MRDELGFEVVDVFCAGIVTLGPGAIVRASVEFGDPV